MMSERPRLRILIIEDETLVAMLIEDVLDELGHHVAGWRGDSRPGWPWPRKPTPISP
jgi:hypothetical protein